MADIVEAAFTDAPPPTAVRTPKVLAAYDHGLPRLHVRPMAANVKTGQLEVIDGDAPVVDSLLAATAWPPLFEAQRCGDSWYIDGSSVTIVSVTLFEKTPIQQAFSCIASQFDSTANANQLDLFEF